MDFSTLEDVLVVLTPTVPEAGGVASDRTAGRRGASGGRPVRTLRILIVVVLAVWLQMALRNVLVLGTAPLDLVLVAVVYIALTSGPTDRACWPARARAWRRTRSAVASLALADWRKPSLATSSGRPARSSSSAVRFQRFVTFVASTIIHAVIFMGLNELLGLAHFGFPWGGVLGQGVANAVVGIVILQAIELLPGAIERRQEKAGGEFRATRRLD